MYKILCYRTLTKGLVLGSCVSAWDPASRAPMKLELLEIQPWGNKVSCSSWILFFQGVWRSKRKEEGLLHLRKKILLLHNSACITDRKSWSLYKTDRLYCGVFPQTRKQLVNIGLLKITFLHTKAQHIPRHWFNKLGSLLHWKHRRIGAWKNFSIQ